MSNTTELLDHGFIRLANLSGPIRRTGQEFDAADTDPANSARMSFGQMDKGRQEEADHKLARYLIRNKHSTPLEMIEVWLEFKLPIFLARQFVRHRTAVINEISGRYVKLPEEWYIPAVAGAAADNVKQGQEGILDGDIEAEYKKRLNDDCQNSYNNYSWAINAGVAMEHARFFLHVNHYTQWLWKQNLSNLMRFLTLRDHSHAQVEAQWYAQAIDAQLRKQLPHLMQAYDDYIRTE